MVLLLILLQSAIQLKIVPVFRELSSFSFSPLERGENCPVKYFITRIVRIPEIVTFLALTKVGRPNFVLILEQSTLLAASL